MAPAATRNALWALMVPLSVLLLGLRLDAAQRARLLPVLLGIGGVSALLALLQLLGEPNGPLFFYRVTNNGSAVGLFANRNHQAVLLATLLPMLVAWAALQRRDARHRAKASGRLHLVAVMCGIAFLLPLILVTGSRSGLLLALVAIIGIALIWPRSRTLNPAVSFGRGLPLARLMLLFALLLATLAVLTIVMGRGVAFDRLLIEGSANERRIAILPHLVALIGLYGWLGTGVGSFEPVWRMHEPDVLLSPRYLNHAHNDWLEVVLTGGLPAVLLLLIAVAAFVVRTLRLATSARAQGNGDGLLVGRVGLLVILLLALASIFDYPLRVPSLACLAMVSALWACAPAAAGERH